MLIPLYVLIGVWGGAGRIGATIKFIVYTMAGSLLMLVAVIALGLARGTFDMTGATSDNTWIFLGFMAAFVVKAPIWPFHGWLPGRAPGGTARGRGGSVRRHLEDGRVRHPAHRSSNVSRRGGGLSHRRARPRGDRARVRLAARVPAPDVRGVIAYSSLAQMCLIVIGLFAANDSGPTGAVLQMINHGLISAALFLLAGTIERRTATGELVLLGGMARGRPVLATLLITTGVIALAVPGSSAFAAEFLVLNGIFAIGGAGPSSALSRSCSPPVHAEAHLRRSARGRRLGRPRAGARPAPGRGRVDRPARRHPARASFWPAAVTDRIFQGRSGERVPGADGRLGRSRPS